MGLKLSRIIKLLDRWGTIHSRILMIGLDDAGKTAILYKLKLNEWITTIPTISFNFEEIRMKDLSFSVWDIGGQDKIRPLWHHYCDDKIDGVMYVVDSADHERLEEAGNELHNIMNDDNIRSVPVLVLANKQDLSTSMPMRKLVGGLRLRNLRHNKWHVQASNAITGEGLYEGFEKLSRMVQAAKKNRV